MGLFVGLEHDGMYSGEGQQKNEPLSASPSDFAVLVWRDQVEDKIPKALPLAAACVRLLTPSLP